MLTCWACNCVLSGDPDVQMEPEGEESPDMMTTCPDCLTQHIYTEDEDGNMVITQAIMIDSTILHQAASRT